MARSNTKHMKALHDLKNLFLYAGVEREEYLELLPSLRHENMDLLAVFSRIAAAMFFVLFISSMTSEGFAHVNTSTYLLSCIEMILIAICTHHVLPNHPRMVMVLVYIFELLLYCFGISISMLHSEMPAVSAIAFLLVSPLLFYDSPLRLSGMISGVVIVFSLLVVSFKDPFIAEHDTWNAITFGVVAVATTVFTMSVKMRVLSQSKQIEFLSQTDLLTGAKNRNHYESQLDVYPSLVTSNLACVYADVNGLHELNNNEGHPTGDAMLKTVAEVLQGFFGTEHTYRVGGDEFVAFRLDGEPGALSSDIDHMSEDLAHKGYHVSFGTATHPAEGLDALDMSELVHEAEMNMYAAKREYYRRSENDRRSR